MLSNNKEANKRLRTVAYWFSVGLVLLGVVFWIGTGVVNYNQGVFITALFYAGTTGVLGVLMIEGVRRTYSFVVSGTPYHTFSMGLWIKVILTFSAFCLIISSALYIQQNIKDKNLYLEAKASLPSAERMLEQCKTDEKKWSAWLMCRVVVGEFGAEKDCIKPSGSLITNCEAIEEQVLLLKTTIRKYESR